MRHVQPRLGAFVVYDRVVPDWRQYYAREERHRLAKESVAPLRGLTDTRGAVLSTAPTLPTELATANDAVKVFTRCHNVEDLSLVIQHIREGLKAPLQPMHYDALFRVFNYHRSKENMEQLLEVVLQRADADLNTFARVIDGLHCLSPADVSARIIRVIGAVEKGYGSLVEHCNRLTTTANVAAGHDVPSEGAGGAGTRGSAPMLMSLMNHVASSASFSSVAPFIVAFWIRALGVRLSDWDYVHLLATLLAKSSDFPRLRAILCAFDGFERGTVSPAALLDQLESRGELLPSSSPVACLCDAMRSSLAHHKVPLDLPVDVGVVNMRVGGIDAAVSGILADIARFPGVGPNNSNAHPVYHTLVLLYSVLRDDAAAVKMLERVLNAHTQWHTTFGTLPSNAKVLVDSAAAASSAKSPMLCPNGQGEVSKLAAAPPAAPAWEEFEVHCHLLLDVGVLFPNVSSRTIRDCMPAYTRLAELSSTTGSDVELAFCGAYAIPSMTTNEEARETLQQITESIDLTKSRMPLVTRMMFKKYAEFCTRHPKRNCKLTPRGLEAREMWGRYLDARDTALALFGSANQARDAMRYLFHNNGSQPALRSADVIERDFNDACQLFKLDPDLMRGTCGPGGSKRPRTSRPHLRLPSHAVPPHLHDAEVYNPYPHVMLKMDCAEAGGKVDAITEDFFAQMWGILMNPALSGSDEWYLDDPDMYLLLMRCLIHRLDWEAAAQLTIRTVEHITYTYMMDHDLTLMFHEIGDPAGCLAFKVATKLFDGKIMSDGQAKRERFHQRQELGQERSVETGRALRLHGSLGILVALADACGIALRMEEIQCRLLGFASAALTADASPGVGVGGEGGDTEVREVALAPRTRLDPGLAAQLHPSEVALVEDALPLGSLYRFLRRVADDVSIGRVDGMYASSIGASIAVILHDYEQAVRLCETPSALGAMVMVFRDALTSLAAMIRECGRDGATSMVLQRIHQFTSDREMPAPFRAALGEAVWMRVLYLTAHYVAHGVVLHGHLDFFISVTPAKVGKVALASQPAARDTHSLVSGNLPRGIPLELGMLILATGRERRTLLREATTYGTDYLDQLAAGTQDEAADAVFHAVYNPSLCRGGVLVVDEFEARIEAAKALWSKALWVKVGETSQLHEHIAALRDMFLCHRGDVWQTFVDQSFGALFDVSQSAKSGLADAVVMRAVADAFPYALHSNGIREKTLSVYDHFSAYLVTSPAASQMGSRSVEDVARVLIGRVGEVALRYRVPPGLQLVVTSRAMEYYHQLFSFLLSMRFALYALHSIRREFSEATSGNRNMTSQLRRASVLFHLLSFLMATITYYMQVDVIQVHFSYLERALETCKSVDEAKRRHDRFVWAVAEGCFSTLDTVGASGGGGGEPLRAACEALFRCAVGLFVLCRRYRLTSWAVVADSKEDSISRPAPLEVSAVLGALETRVQQNVVAVFTGHLSYSSRASERALWARLDFNRFFSANHYANTMAVPLGPVGIPLQSGSAPTSAASVPRAPSVAAKKPVPSDARPSFATKRPHSTSSK